MNGLGKERIAETVAAAAIVALLAAALALGAKVLDTADSGRVAKALEHLSSGILVPAGSPVTAKAGPVRPSYPVHGIYDLARKDGRRVGTGMAVTVEGAGWSVETLVLLDDRDRVSSVSVRDGSAGVRAAELAAYLRRRSKDGTAGMDAVTDPRDLEFAVGSALETAVRQLRSGREGVL